MMLDALAANTSNLTVSAIGGLSSTVDGDLKLGNGGFEGIPPVHTTSSHPSSSIPHFYWLTEIEDYTEDEDNKI